MILIELIKVFCLALIALTGLVLFVGIISEALKSGMSPMHVIAAAPLLLPSLLPYTMPTATLFATCIVYGRLAADNEVLALKSAGTHIVHVVWPAAMLGAITTMMTLWLSLDIIPCTHFVMRSRLGADIEEVLYSMLRNDGFIRHPRASYEIHVKGISGRTLQGVVFKRHAANGAGCDFIAYAKEAVLRVDLVERQLLVELTHCQIVDGNVIGVVEDRTLPVDLPSDWGKTALKVRPTDMTWGELLSYEGKFREERDKLNREITGHQKQLDQGRADAHYAEHIRHLANERRIRDNYLDAIACEMHVRPAFALGCLCFALVGCPIGVWLGKRDYLSAFVTCFLPIVIVYYPLMFCMINLARGGKLAPWLGIYNADLLVLIVGAILFRWLARH